MQNSENELREQSLLSYTQTNQYLHDNDDETYQTIPVRNGLPTEHRIKHLRGQRIALSQQHPVVFSLPVPADPVARHHSSQVVRVRPVREGKNRLLFAQHAGRFHVRRVHSFHGSAGPQ